MPTGMKKDGPAHCGCSDERIPDGKAGGPNSAEARSSGQTASHGRVPAIAKTVPFEQLSSGLEAVDDASLRRGPSSRVRAFGDFRLSTASGVDDSDPIELEKPRVKQWN